MELRNIKTLPFGHRSDQYETMQRLCISESNQFSFLFKWLRRQATNLRRIGYLIQLKGKYATNVVNFFFSHFHVNWEKGSKKKKGLVKNGFFWLLKFHILRIDRIHKNKRKILPQEKNSIVLSNLRFCQCRSPAKWRHRWVAVQWQQYKSFRETTRVILTQAFLKTF